MDLARLIITRKSYKISRVCRVLTVSRSNQYQNKANRASSYKKPEDEQVLAEIVEITKTRATYGYPRITALINRKRRLLGKSRWNKKRIFRVMSINKMLLNYAKPKPKRLHLGQIITLKSNVRFCSDIFTIPCWNGEKVNVGFSLDCCDREAISFIAEKRPLFHGDIIRLIDQTVTSRFGEYIEKLPFSIQWLSDQGPQYTCEQTRKYGAEWGFDVRTTPAYSPESNGMAEAFVKMFKRDYVYANELWTGEFVLRQLSIWFDDYNRNHPHSGLQMMSPLEYREVCNNLSV